MQLGDRRETQTANWTRNAHMGNSSMKKQPIEQSRKHIWWVCDLNHEIRVQGGCHSSGQTVDWGFGRGGNPNWRAESFGFKNSPSRNPLAALIGNHLLLCLRKHCFISFVLRLHVIDNGLYPHHLISFHLRRKRRRRRRRRRKEEERVWR